MPNPTQDLHTVDVDSFSYIFEQNATVPLTTSDGLVRVNVFRPKTDEKVPVLCTYGPYGKDIPYAESVVLTQRHSESWLTVSQLPRKVIR